MGFFTNKSTGQVFKTKQNSDGHITSPIGTTLHHTGQEDKIRLINRITERNKNVKESHEEKIRGQRLAKAEFDKKENKRMDQQKAIIDEIETRRRLLKQAKHNPELLDHLNAVNPQGGNLPKDFEKNRSAEQKKFFDEEQKKTNSIRESAQGDIKRAKETIEKNSDDISKLHHEAEQLRKNSSNIPEINHENTRRINEIQMEIQKIEEINREFNEDIDRGVESVKKAEQELGRLRFVAKDSAFGTIGDTPHETLPQGTLEARKRAKDSFEERKTGKGTAPIFPEGFEHKRKIRNPVTGKEYFSNKVPDNKKFIGFDKTGKPVFVDKHREEEPVHTNIPREVHHEGDPTSHAGESLRIIPGLAREDY